MSLVNQMLKDLEARRAPDMAGAAVLRNLEAPALGGSRRRWLAVWVAALSLAVTVGVGAWAYLGKPVPPLAATPPVPERALAAAEPGRESPPAGTAERPAELAPKQPESMPPPADAPTARPSAAAVGSTETLRQRAKAVSGPESRSAAVRQTPAAASPPVGQAVAATQPEPQPAPLSQDSAASVAQASEPAVRRVPRAPSVAERAGHAYRRGAALVKEGRIAEAEVSLREALALDPGLAAARELLAVQLVRAARGPEAEELLRSSLEANPAQRGLALIYGRVLAERGATEAAVEALERALPAVELDPDYYGLLAALYQRLRRHGQAVAAYRAALRVAPGRGAWWLGLGLSLESLGERAAALQALEQARRVGGLSREVEAFVQRRLDALRAATGAGAEQLSRTP